MRPVSVAGCFIESINPDRQFYRFWSNKSLENTHTPHTFWHDQLCPRLCVCVRVFKRVGGRILLLPTDPPRLPPTSSLYYFKCHVLLLRTHTHTHRVRVAQTHTRTLRGLDLFATRCAQTQPLVCARAHAHALDYPFAARAFVFRMLCPTPARAVVCFYQPQVHTHTLTHSPNPGTHTRCASARMH